MIDMVDVIKIIARPIDNTGKYYPPAVEYNSKELKAMSIEDIHYIILTLESIKRTLQEDYNGK